MKLTLNYYDQEVEIEFDPSKVIWKSQNFGQYSHNGLYIPEIDEHVFVKRNIDTLDSANLLCSMRDDEKPLPYMPEVFGLFEIEGLKDKYKSYLFMEKVSGCTLLETIKEVKRNDCHQILRSVLFSLETIIDKGHWFTDLDLRNIMFHKEQGEVFTWLIDIDSCLPEETMFVDFMKNRGGLNNVNERYWSCMVKVAKTQGVFEKLSGKTVTQAAFVYFAIDLFFRITYPDNPFNLKPDDIFRLMNNTSKYISAETQDQWRDIHNLLVEDPENGCEWEELDTFATLLFGFDEPLIPKASVAEAIAETVLEEGSNLLDKLFKLFK
ncbi:MAG: hypothetical protein HQK84_11765 [Nitrospinae bacterium]|nr:hypothetical protein [Nitrospinota bacterium]